MSHLSQLLFSCYHTGYSFPLKTDPSSPVWPLKVWVPTTVLALFLFSLCSLGELIQSQGQQLLSLHLQPGVLFRLVYPVAIWHLHFRVKYTSQIEQLWNWTPDCHPKTCSSCISSFLGEWQLLLSSCSAKNLGITLDPSFYFPPISNLMANPVVSAFRIHPDFDCSVSPQLPHSSSCIIICLAYCSKLLTHLCASSFSTRQHKCCLFKKKKKKRQTRSQILSLLCSISLCPSRLLSYSERKSIITYMALHSLAPLPSSLVTSLHLAHFSPATICLLGVLQKY